MHKTLFIQNFSYSIFFFFLSSTFYFMFHHQHRIKIKSMIWLHANRDDTFFLLYAHELTMTMGWVRRQRLSRHLVNENMHFVFEWFACVNYSLNLTSVDCIRLMVNIGFISK